MEDIRNKINNNEELNKDEFNSLLTAIGLASDNKHHTEGLADLKKNYKVLLLEYSRIS